jgi:hypothetical protein
MLGFLPHLALFLLVGWLISLAYFAREGRSAGGILRIATLKLLKYTAWTALLVLVMWCLERFFIAS